MKAKKLHLITWVMVPLIVGMLAGGFGLLVGRAQTPWAMPTLVPTMVVPTPTQIIPAPTQIVPTPSVEPSPGSASISGRVWHDLCAIAGGEEGSPVNPSGDCIRTGDGGYQADGLLEVGEPGIGGVSIQLGVGPCPAYGLATTKTGAGGVYVFTELSAGTYCVSVDALRAENASLLPGSWTFPSAAENSSVASYTVTLREDERRSAVNFGWDYRFLPLPEPAPPEPSPTPGCTDRASFVKDVTIADGTYLSPGQPFVKIWRLRNTGTCTWTTDYAIVFVDGHKMGGPASVPLRGPVVPGSVVDLSVALNAPAGNGTYEGKWRLRNANGGLFGTESGPDGAAFWVRIIVGPPPTPTPAVTGWRGEYYGNRYLAGEPALVRDDAPDQGTPVGINFDWGYAAPSTGIPADGFSIRWTRTLSLGGGTYRFYVRSDDGVRVWLDGELIVDQWRDASGTTYTAERTLGAGGHAVRIEYYENKGAANVRFWWERAGDFPQWRGEYFPNVTLVGAPVVTRNDVTVDFNWGRNAPATGLPVDGFSARWTRALVFEEGLYRFHAVVDDGARLYVDDTLVIDAWQDGGRHEVTADRALANGNHSLRVEYYERAGDALIQVWWEKLPAYPDWRGEYWSNRSLSGNPALVRNDAAIDFKWGQGAPAAGLPADNFSARWTRAAKFESATYRFHVLVDDGARLWVDDQMIVDTWRDGAAREVTADYALAQGTHRLRFEFYERTGEARIRVWWEKVTSPSYPEWKGEYWSNRDLKGSTAFVRNDRTIEFDWGRGAVVVGLPVDDFSARWSRTMSFEPGLYRFSAKADDGVRLYVDGNLVLDEWHDSDGVQVYVVDRTLRDQHRLVVEYYERGGDALVKFWWKRIGDWPTPTPAPNRPPVAADDSAITDEDTRVYINVLANDSDPDGDTITVSAFQASSVRGGKVNCASAGVCTYTPPADFNGSDTFTYTASDGKGGTDAGTVTVTVNPMNDPPVAVDDSTATDRDASVSINVLANDSDPDGDALTVSQYDVVGGQGGTVSCTAAGVCTYTPPAAFSGSDAFGYTISDGNGGTDSAKVTVIVGSTTNPPPVPTGARLNEILPVPAPLDRNGDGVLDELDEWIELYNAGSGPVDLGGWLLDDGEGGSVPYQIPEGVVLQSDAFVLFYGRDTGVVLDDGGDDVRLLEPDGALVDAVTFDHLAPNASYSRGADGTWHSDWPPSPGVPNLPLAPTSGSERGVSSKTTER